MVVLESTNVSLTCKAKGYPEPYVMWRREDGENYRYNGENGEINENDSSSRGMLITEKMRLIFQLTSWTARCYISRKSAASTWPIICASPPTGCPRQSARGWNWKCSVGNSFCAFLTWFVGNVMITATETLFLRQFLFWNGDVKISTKYFYVKLKMSTVPSV